MPPNERQTLLLYRAKRKNLIRDRRERRAQDLDSSNDDDVGPARRLLLLPRSTRCKGGLVVDCQLKATITWILTSIYAHTCTKERCQNPWTLIQLFLRVYMHMIKKHTWITN